MAIKYRPTGQKTGYVQYLIYFVIAIVIAFVQTGLLSYIAINEVTPDLMLILVVWIALKNGQFAAIFAGFAAGLLLDIVSIDVIGTNALAKTVAAYLAGFFYKEDKLMTGDIRFIGIVALCSLLNNVIYFFFYLKASELSFIPFFLRYGVGLAVYTTVLALPPMIFDMRKN